jgi:beta-xylosidase
LQARYGWTDDQILSLPYHVFNQKVRTVAKAVSLEKKEELRNAAFIGYQLYITTPSMGKKENYKFSKWLEMFGVSLEEESQRIDTDYEAEAQRISGVVADAFKRKS